MRTKTELSNILKRIDSKGYKAYKDIKGVYDFEKYLLFIDHVQSDPFAPPSRIRIRVSNKVAGIPDELFHNKVRTIALEDFYTRHIGSVINNISKVNGTGKSGVISIMKCGQEVLLRTSVVINKEYIEVRLSMGLPARGRRVMGRQAESMLFHTISQIVEEGILFKSINYDRALMHVEVIEDQNSLRQQLEEQNMVSFIANNSILVRESGISDKPMKGKNVVPFKSPQSMETTFILPNHGKISGMGIKKGITLIVGGGYHGKSTILKAVERGVYNHIPGDGREYVVTVSNACKIRAEDGRFVENVDISPFINNLPSNEDTSSFSTLNASGSTSQAANISEAIEAKSSLLLLDEDTCATNFMIRDARMQRLVNEDKEPITPFIDNVKPIYKELGISTILVIGGAGDYFDVADNVIMMDEYIAKDVSKTAKNISIDFPVERIANNNDDFKINVDRKPLKESFIIKARKEKIKTKGTYSILYGYNEIDLQNVEQLIDASQTIAIGHIIKYIKDNYNNNNLLLSQAIEKVYEDINREGIDYISPFYRQHPGDYSLPRIQEVYSAVNRLRTLKIRR